MQPGQAAWKQAFPAHQEIKIVGITMGDPGGIGPEVLVRALAARNPEPSVKFLVFGHKQRLVTVAQQLGVASPLHREDVVLLEHPETVSGDFPWGILSDVGALAQVGYLRMALEAASLGQIQALVTGPIHKQALARCGLPYHGHTDWLEDHFGVRRAVMMLAGPRLRTVPCTIHIPLRDVPQQVTFDLILDTVVIVDREMRQRMAIAAPRIAVCGLNPHAGDGGLLGHEDQEVIAPAILAAQQRGILASGPFPGDTACFLAVRGQFDVVVGMYHDQVLAPLKLLHFDDAVNLTLGLPLLRTSVDHGTAYDIAGQGIASPTSMEHALSMAVDAVLKG